MRATIVLLLLVALAPAGAGSPEPAGLLAEARRLLAAGRIRQAAEAAEAAVAADRSDPGAWHLLGEIRYAGRRWPQAIEAFEQARSLLPEEPRLAAAIGICRFELQDLEGARASLAEAVRLDPTLAQPHLFLGRIARVQGDPVAAEAQLRRAVSLDGEQPLNHYYLGLLLFQEGRLDEAAAAFRRTLELSRDFPGAHLNLGLVLTRLGQRDEGRRHLDRFESLTEVATRDRQRSLRAASRLGAAREDLDAGRLEAALALALEAREIAPEAAAVHLHLAVIYDRLGRPEQSLQARAEAERLARGGP